MVNRRTTKRRNILHVEVDRFISDGLALIAKDRSKELGLIVTVSDVTRDVCRKAIEAHRAGRAEPCCTDA